MLAKERELEQKKRELEQSKIDEAAIEDRVSRKTNGLDHTLDKL